MSGPPPPVRKRRFHEPVVGSNTGDGSSEPVLALYLAQLPPSSLGSAAEVVPSGSRSRVADVLLLSREREGARRRSK